MYEIQEAAAQLDLHRSEQELGYSASAHAQEHWVVPDGYVDGPDVVPWTSRNQSQLVPLLPMEVMWLLEATEERLRNASGIPFALATARRLAAFNSVAYCQHENIAAWNCSR